MTSPSDPVETRGKTVAGVYFDGRTARPHAVTVSMPVGRIVIEGTDVRLDLPIAAAEIAAPLGHAPRLIRFADGAVCEVADADGFDRLLKLAGVAVSPVHRWESSARWIATAVISFLAICWFGYRTGLPLLAQTVADRLPPAAVQQLGRQSLEVLDRTMLGPSGIDAGRQDELTAEFEALRLPSGTGLRHRLVFRRGNSIGANAFALPSGDIVVTDELIALATDDRQILGVLAHETGHLDRRHGLRSLLQRSIVALLIGWYVGDVSSLAASAPSAFIDAKYSRDFEREADDYAIAVMRDNAIPPGALADMLDRLQAGEPASPPFTYLSTHPRTEERIRRLRGL